MTLAVTLTMPRPLPCRGSLPLRLALVLSPSQCSLSLATGLGCCRCWPRRWPLCYRRSWPRRRPVCVAAAVEVAATTAVAVEPAAVTAEVLSEVLAMVLTVVLAVMLVLVLAVMPGRGAGPDACGSAGWAAARGACLRHWPAAPAVKLAVTLTMPWPLPCRGSLPLQLAIVLSPSPCWLSLAAGSTNRLSSERARFDSLT